MSLSGRVSRRRFLSASGALAAHSVASVHPLAQAIAGQGSHTPANIIPPALDIVNGVKPLFKGATARPLRYAPIAGDFVIRNGGEFFNRPLYGKNNDFRADAGDRPEFALYLPGHGGNLKFGIARPAGSKWAANADEVIARYRPGRMIYEIKDALLNNGSLRMEVLPAGAGLLVKVEFARVPRSTTLTWAFAGADGRKGSRNGDIGCESMPVSRFFQVRPEDCANNVYSVEPAGTGTYPSARLHSPAGDLLLAFPRDSHLAVAGYPAWSSAPTLTPASARSTPALPVLTGSVQVQASPLYFAVWRNGPRDGVATPDPAAEFERRSIEIAAVAATLHADTPDPCIDTAAAAFGPPADFLWDDALGCVMHGDVAWRARYAGWRGPYCLDALGRHDRAKQQFRHWLALQNVSPVTTEDPATGPADPNTHLARKEALLHSNGDLSKNHYDMNMVFFDVLLRHLRWTGDLEFAREVWPAIERQLAWERRLFRRTYTGNDGAELPLYEAYAAIWASDNLQYNGGGAAHSSAYNIFALRSAAAIARLLQKDATAYEKEAELTHRAMQELLWLPKQGAFAESKDLYGPQTAYPNPALWTVYHAIDSEVPTPRQAWQMAAERIAALVRIPVHGEGVPPGPWYMLACSNWMPYLWSLTLILLAENAHMALAMWQAGMREDAFALFKGALLDSMFMGLCPGDFHMTSTLDPYRQEAQRDFGDPIGIASRAFVEGLFGLQPNLVANRITLRPGFPDAWNHAALKHLDFDLSWHRNGLNEAIKFSSRFPQAVPLTLVLPARTTRLPMVTDHGHSVPCAFDLDAVGAPALIVKLPAARSYAIALSWSGNPPVVAPPSRRYALGQPIDLPAGVSLSQIDDPQRCLVQGRAAAAGVHTVFANMKHSGCAWSMPISFEVKATSSIAPVPKLAKNSRAEPLDLSAILAHRISEIFAKPYAEPRSPFCSLSLPDTLLGGWANLNPPPKIDDTGLRAAGGMLETPLGVVFRTPAGRSPNCLLLSHFKPHGTSIAVPLTGNASGIYLLLAGTTHPQCSRMQNALATVAYTDGASAQLPLRNPETWWPIEQDYMIDDHVFPSHAPLPPRVDLATGRTRILDLDSFKGNGRDVPGGAATILYLPLDPAKTVASLKLEVSLYPIVVALLAATLVR